MTQRMLYILKVPFERWRKQWGDRLERLDNGFIVFSLPMFELKNLLDGIVEARKILKF